HEIPGLALVGRTGQKAGGLCPHAAAPEGATARRERRAQNTAAPEMTVLITVGATCLAAFSGSYANSVKIYALCEMSTVSMPCFRKPARRFLRRRSFSPRGFGTSPNLPAGWECLP